MIVRSLLPCIPDIMGVQSGDQFCGFAGRPFFDYKIKKNCLVRFSIWTHQTSHISLRRRTNYEFLQ